jgi:polyvinyl alcohol dehydrogenase (cytochrome)
MVAAAICIAPALAQAQAPDAQALYTRSCAQCHDGGNDRAPSRDALRGMTAERVLAAMETGPMITMANNRTAAERRAIAEFLSGKPFGSPLVTAPAPAAMCKASNAFDSTKGPQWSGWGQNAGNTRMQESGGIAAVDVPKLNVKWAFAFPGDLQVYSHATLSGGRLFIGSWGGKVYSLDAATGCIRWYFQADAGVRSAVTIARVKTVRGDRDVAFFGDTNANAYALDATTGEMMWKTKVDTFPVARINGSPAFHNGRIYVGVASGEEAVGAVPSYECCKFRGSMLALDAATGKQIWKTYTIEDEPKPTKKNAVGTQLYGPSGAPIWTSPVIDPSKNALYITTGNNYSDPGSSMSDAFVAMDLDTGRILWTRQMTSADAYTAACRLPDRTNCADSNGPDYDFGASPILTTLPNGKRALLAGQKSGVVHAIDPDNKGAILWQTRVGHGGTMGGVQWGSAVDRNNIYVALSDAKRIMLNYSQSTDIDPSEGGGMFALRLDSGERVWYTAPPGCGTRKRCSPAQSAAVSAIPGVAFSGSVDGHIRGYSTADGKIVWDFDTIRDYTTVNGVPGKGGSLDGPGPVIGGGMVFVNSGYPTAGGTPGNVLIAFSVDGK